ncbi:MAG: oligosaccharide flippase family protein, partial [Bacteroidota bacterium]
MAWIDRYSKNPFIKNVAIMFSGNGLALVIPFLIAPFISRIYTPEDFAGFELFVKIATLIGVASALRFELAIILPKKNEEASALVKLSLRLVLVTTLLTALVVIPFRTQISIILNNADLSYLLWFLPLMVLCLGFYHVFTQYAIRLKNFKILSETKISGALCNNGSKYLLGLNLPIAASLVWGQIIGLVVPVISFLRDGAIRAELANIHKSTFSTQNLFRKYRDFPIISASHAFFDEGQKTVLFFLISAFYGEIELGLFAYALRYIRVPLMVFGVSISQVLNEKWARDLNEGIPINGPVLRTSLFLLLTGIVPFSLLFFFGEDLFSFVFGADWTRAGRFSEIMAVWLFLNFIVSPLSFLPVIMKKQTTNFLVAVVGNLLTLSVVGWLAIAGRDFMTVLIALVVCNSLHSVFIWFW